MVRNNAKKRDLEKAGILTRRLSEVMTDPDSDLDHLLEGILKLGCELFNLEVGVVAKIGGSRYKVVARNAPSDLGLRPGQTLKLEDTLCAQTMVSQGPFTVESMENGKFADHPARTEGGLQTYLGAQVRINGKPYGTLSFAGLSPKKRTFSAVEIDCLQLMAAWLGTELARRTKEDQLGTANRKLEETRQRVKQLSTHDPLTGVLNRDAILRRLSDERNRAAREKTKFGVFLMDVDRYRRINDAIGYAGGDEVLVEIIARISGCFRNYDHLGRLGGKQFLAVLPGCSLADAAEIAERARVALTERPITHPNGEFEITASFGVSCADSSDLTDDELLSTADKALYLAKQRGKNRVRGASPRGQDSPTAVV
jgi:diguanylate cyclase (GGDEF)-like protein